MWRVDSVKGRRLCKHGIGKRWLHWLWDSVSRWLVLVLSWRENGGRKGIAAGVLCGSGLINCASKSAAAIPGCMVVAKEAQASQHVKV